MSIPSHFFAVVPRLYHLFLVFLSTPYLELYILPLRHTSVGPFSSLVARTTSEMKFKNVLAPQTILFYFRRGYVLK